jgi:hypothetical protein
MLTKKYAGKQWPFIDTPNTAVYTTWGIVEEGNSILIVTHYQDDGAWQFHPANTTWRTDDRIAALEQIVLLDPSVLELSDLPIGWMASRNLNTSPWVRQPMPSNVIAKQLTVYDNGQSSGAIPLEISMSPDRLDNR